MCEHRCLDCGNVSSIGAFPKRLHENEYGEKSLYVTCIFCDSIDIDIVSASGLELEKEQLS